MKYVWVIIQFSVFIAWIYTLPGQIEESMQNPVEESANDVPYPHICRNIEINLRDLLEETDLPAATIPENDILL